MGPPKLTEVAEPLSVPLTVEYPVPAMVLNMPSVETLRTRKSEKSLMYRFPLVSPTMLYIDFKALALAGAPSGELALDPLPAIVVITLLVTSTIRTRRFPLSVMYTFQFESIQTSRGLFSIADFAKLPHFRHRSVCGLVNFNVSIVSST
jgi:hypothetical protein